MWLKIFATLPNLGLKVDAVSVAQLLENTPTLRNLEYEKMLQVILLSESKLFYM